MAGVAVANALVLIATFSWHPPRLTDYDFFAFQAAYWIPLIALGFSRARRIDLGLLGFLIAYYVVVALRIVEPPAGGWSASMGL